MNTETGTRMSAREKLIRFAKENEPDDGAGVPIDPETGHMVTDVEAHVGRMLDDLAHELAEEQRAYARECGLALDDGPYVSLGDVIDQIDPHVGA
jgi:hypothetical protein